MGQEEAVSIRPAAGGPLLRKNARLMFHEGVLEATDPRGRTRRFNLSDGNGPYEFRYGTWKGDADFALIDGSGHALLLLDQTSFHFDDISRLRHATGLKLDETGSQPPTRRDTVALVNLPYLKIGSAVFAVGAAAFGLWSVTHIEFFVLGVTLPAVLILIPVLIFGRRSILSPEDAKAEFAKLQPDVDEALALADQWLTEHRRTSAEDEKDPQPRTPPTPEAHPPADASPDAY
jgi:hypothetical protein